jgi:hypothetical protein
MSKSSKDRIFLCVFTYTDGRQCNMPRTNNGLNFCYFHEQQERKRLQCFQAGAAVAECLNSDLQTSCSLNSALAKLFRAGAMNFITPQTINSLTRLGQLMVETHLLAKNEFLSCYHADWADIVQESPLFNPKKEPASNQSSNTNAPNPDPEDPSGAKSKSTAMRFARKKHQPFPPPANEQTEDETQEETEKPEKVGEEEEAEQVQPAAKAAAAATAAGAATTSTICPPTSGPIPYHPHLENGHVGPVIPEKPPMSSREVRRLLRQVYGLGRRR